MGYKNMMKRRDSGFTLIELMIVIAVIGILAIVLVPRVGVIKTQAKESGIDTNIRLVQGFVESKIDKWVSKDTDQSVVVDDIVSAFSFTNTEKKLINPITSVPHDAAELAFASLATTTDTFPVFVITEPDQTPGTDGPKGSVIVNVTSTATDAAITAVTIYAYGTDGKQLDERTVTITP